MKAILIACAPSLLIMFAIVACGDTLRLKATYLVATSNGQYIFVMLSPDPKIDESITSLNERDEAFKIRSKYETSGLYPNDGTTTPLWTVDWYAYKVFVSSDGRYLIRQGPWASSQFDEALTFFANGKEIRGYQVKDLVDFVWLLPHTASHFSWLESVYFDGAGQILMLTTYLKDKYTFNITTGEIISSRRPLRLSIYGICILLISLILILVGRKRLVRRRFEAFLIV